MANIEPTGALGGATVVGGAVPAPGVDATDAPGPLDGEEVTGVLDTLEVLAQPAAEVASTKMAASTVRTIFLIGVPFMA
jgi:hypothetical protein